MVKRDKRRKVTPEKLKKMEELRKRGMTYKAISDRLNLSYLTVYKYLTKVEPVAKEEKVEVKEEEVGVKEEPVAEKKEEVGFFAKLKKWFGS